MIVNTAENYPTLYENRWTTPDDYAGFNPVGDYVLYAHTRDSGLLSEVNYKELESMFRLDPVWDDGECPEDYAQRCKIIEDADEFVYTFRASHWAHGWVDYLMISKKAPEYIISEANESLNALADYPAVNEDAYSEAEYNAIIEFWDNLDDDEKKEYSTDSDGTVYDQDSDLVYGQIPELAYESIREIVNQ